MIDVVLDRKVDSEQDGARGLVKCLSSGRFILSPDVRNWLSKYKLEQNRDYDCNIFAGSDDFLVQFKEQDRDVALLFKLTWGGA